MRASAGRRSLIGGEKNAFSERVSESTSSKLYLKRIRRHTLFCAKLGDSITCVKPIPSPAQLSSKSFKAPLGLVLEVILMNKCTYCQKTLHIGVNVAGYQEGVLGQTGFVKLADIEVFCSDECLRKHLEELAGPKSEERAA